MNFAEIIERIKKVKNYHDDHEVAELLGFSRSAFSERKRRDSIPQDKLTLFCERENINMDWLLTGKGEMKLYFDRVAETPATYNVKDPVMAEIIDLLETEPPEVKRICLKILKNRQEIKEGFQSLMDFNKQIKEDS